MQDGLHELVITESDHIGICTIFKHPGLHSGWNSKQREVHDFHKLRRVSFFSTIARKLSANRILTFFHRTAGGTWCYRERTLVYHCFWISLQLWQWEIWASDSLHWHRRSFLLGVLDIKLIMVKLLTAVTVGILNNVSNIWISVLFFQSLHFYLNLI